MLSHDAFILRKTMNVEIIILKCQKCNGRLKRSL